MLPENLDVTYKYVVVHFKVSNAISAVPKSWISEDNQQTWCKWPKKNCRNMIIKNAVPGNDWDAHEVYVICRFESYSDAFDRERKESKSASESELGRGKRKIKKKKPRAFSPSSGSSASPDSDDTKYVTPKRSKTERNKMGKTDHTKTKIRHAESNELRKGSTGDNTAKNRHAESDESRKGSTFDSTVKIRHAVADFFNSRSNNPSVPISEPDDGVLSAANILELPTITPKVIPSVTPIASCVTASTAVGSSAHSSTPISDHSIAGDLKSIKTSLSLIQASLNLLVERNNSVTSCHPTNVDPPSMSLIPPNLLPLRTIDDLIELEILIKDRGASNQLLQKFLSIGGSTYKKHITKCLKFVFQNCLAKDCSWCEQKRNHQLEGLQIIDLIFTSTRRAFQHITATNFQTTVMDWFRFGKARFEKEQSQN